MWACRLVLWSHQSDRRIRVRISHQSYHSIWISCTNHSVWVLLSFKWCHEIRGCAQRILGSSDERNGLWPLRESRQLRSRFIGIWKLKPVFHSLTHTAHAKQLTFHSYHEVQSEHTQSSHCLNIRQFSRAWNVFHQSNFILPANCRRIILIFSLLVEW